MGDNDKGKLSTDTAVDNPVVVLTTDVSITEHNGSRQFWAKFVITIILTALLACYLSLTASPAMSAMCCMCILSVLLCTTIYTAAWVVSDIVSGSDPIKLHHDRLDTSKKSVNPDESLGASKKSVNPDESLDGHFGFVVLCIVLVCFMICLVGTTTNQNICYVAGGTILISVLMYGGYSFINMLSMYGAYDHTQVLGKVYPDTHTIGAVLKSITANREYIRGTQSNIGQITGGRWQITGGQRQITGGGGTVKLLFYNPVNPLATNISHIQAGDSHVGVIMMVPENDMDYFKDVAKYLQAAKPIRNTDYIRYATISTYAAARARQEYCIDKSTDNIFPMAHHDIIPNHAAVLCPGKRDIEHDPVNICMKDTPLATQATITHYFIKTPDHLQKVYINAVSKNIKTLYIHIDGSIAAHWALYVALNNIMFVHSITTVILYIPTAPEPTPECNSFVVVSKDTLREYHQAAHNNHDCAVLIATFPSTILPKADNTSKKSWEDVKKDIATHINHINSAIDEVNVARSLVIATISADVCDKHMSAGMLNTILQTNVQRAITEYTKKIIAGTEKSREIILRDMPNIESVFARDKQLETYMPGFISYNKANNALSAEIPESIFNALSKYFTQPHITMAASNVPIKLDDQLQAAPDELIVLAWCANMYLLTGAKIKDNLLEKLKNKIKERAKPSVQLSYTDRYALYTMLDNCQEKTHLTILYILLIAKYAVQNPASTETPIPGHVDTTYTAKTTTTTSTITLTNVTTTTDNTATINITHTDKTTITKIEIKNNTITITHTADLTVPQLNAEIDNYIKSPDKYTSADTKIAFADSFVPNPIPTVLYTFDSTAKPVDASRFKFKDIKAATYGNKPNMLNLLYNCTNFPDDSNENQCLKKLAIMAACDNFDSQDVDALYANTNVYNAAISIAKTRNITIPSLFASGSSQLTNAIKCAAILHILGTHVSDATNKTNKDAFKKLKEDLDNRLSTASKENIPSTDEIIRDIYDKARESIDSIDKMIQSTE